MSNNIADLVLTNARIVQPLAWPAPVGSIVVRKGRIAEMVFDPNYAPPARVTRDVGGAYVLPGLIDGHVHFRVPGLGHKEDWVHGSRAAVAGGVTTVIDMPNVFQPGGWGHYVDPLNLPERIALVQGQSLVDFAFHLGVTPDSIPVLERVDPTYVPSVKIFGAGHNTAKFVIREDRDLDRIFEIAAHRGLLLTVHAEDADTLDLLSQSQPEPDGLVSHERTYGRAAALISVGRILDRVRRYGTKVHVLHVSSAEEVDLLDAAARAGLPISFEALGHHLTFTIEDEHLGSRGKLRPALRTARDRERLWCAVLGSFCKCVTIGSDHAPHTLEEKGGRFTDAPPGFPGVQELAPTFLTGLRWAGPTGPEVETPLDNGSDYSTLPYSRTRIRAVTPDEQVGYLALLGSYSPAKVYGLSHRKGDLRVGYDADLVVIDLNRSQTMTAANVYAKCGWSAYEGRELFGVPTLTIRAGRIVYDADASVGQRFGEPDGRYVPVRTG